MTLAVLTSVAPAGQRHNWTEADLVLVSEASRCFYLPDWLTLAIYKWEDGVPGYEGGQSTQSAFASKHITSKKTRQIWTMCQTVRHYIQDYEAKPYVRQAWAKSQLSEGDFLFGFKTDMLRFMASRWKPRQPGEAPGSSEAKWAFGVRALARQLMDDQ